MKKIYRKILYLALTASLLLGGALSVRTPALAAAPDKMEVHFLDVGQGDSTLVTCGGHAMLIDTGDDSKGTAIQNYLQKQKITKLDYLVLTHPDADHIGGAPVIITKFDISRVFVSNYEKDNKTWQKLIQSLDDKRLKALTPKVNSQYSLGTATITILAPGKEYDNPNDASIALVLKNGSRSFLFTGDAGEEAEKDILKNVDADMLSADVYKVGHHGSKYSTSADFFQAVDPEHAVISCGEGNSYGHPHAETLNTLRTNGVKVYRTDEEGTIIASTDGKSLTFNVPASDTWKAGEPTGGTTAATKSTAKAVAKTGQTDAQAAAKSAQADAQAAAKPAQADPSSTAKPAQTDPQAAAEAKQADTPAAAAQPQNQESAPAVEEKPQENAPAVSNELTYVLNSKTKKFHRPSCNSLPTKNRVDSSESRDSIIAQGYEPCKKCNP